MSYNASKVRRGFRRRILHVSNLIRSSVASKTSCNVIEMLRNFWTFLLSTNLGLKYSYDILKFQNAIS